MVIYDYSKTEYTKAKEPVTIICRKHGEFKQRPLDHVLKSCGRELANKAETYTKAYFVEKANLVHFNKYDYSKTNYINSQTKIIITCPLHGDFELTPANHLYGQGCPKCRLVGLTKLYNKIKLIFPKLEIIFEADYKIIPWIGNLRTDIYIPLINLGIELMGPQHYEEIPFFKTGNSLEITQERDNRKRIKCKENNCTLIELKYYYTNQDFKGLVSAVTKKLEELYKIYYSDNTTNQEKDNAAIEAGKLLTDEILNNTIDNTGLLTTN